MVRILEHACVAKHTLIWSASTFLIGFKFCKQTLSHAVTFHTITLDSVCHVGKDQLDHVTVQLTVASTPHEFELLPLNLIIKNHVSCAV